MASGDFFRGLSTGIFNELSEQQKLKTERDAQSQRDLVQMLSGLAGSIEPEGLPLLMGHIWDTMGIKKKAGGKGLRGFLDAFSGMPDRTVEDQLGSKFKQLTEGMIGPQQAKAARQQHGLPVALRALAGDKTATPQEATRAAGLEGKMVFRDPRQEKLEEIETRYGAQLQGALDRETYSKGLAAKYQKERDEIQNKAKINQIFTNRMLTAQSPQIARAYQLWHDAYNMGMTPTAPTTDPGMLPPQEFMARAGQILTDEQSNKNIATKELGPLRRNQSAYYGSQVNALKVGKPENKLAREKFDEQLYGKASGMFQEFGKADTEMKSQQAEIKRITDVFNTAAKNRNERQQAQGDKAVRFDEQLGQFVGPGALVLNATNKDLIKKFNDARGKFRTAEGARKTKGEELRSKHGKYVEAGEGDTFRLRSREELEGKPISGGPVRPTPPTKGVLGNVGLTGGVRAPKGDERSIDIRGKGQVLPGMEIPSKIDPNIKYRITYVHPSGKLAYGVIVKSGEQMNFDLNK